MGNLGSQKFYQPSEYEAKIKELELTVTQVVCAGHTTTFVCDDESLYGIGQPVTYKDRYTEAHYLEKTWIKLEKPHECSDYLKVVASRSNRLVLTKSGQLFC